MRRTFQVLLSLLRCGHDADGRAAVAEEVRVPRGDADDGERVEGVRGATDGDGGSHQGRAHRGPRGNLATQSTCSTNGSTY